MQMAATVLVGAIALFHIWIVVLEMFLWTKPIGRKTFGQSKEQAENSKVLAANQGLYNGFLAAALIVGLLHPDPSIAHAFKVYGLICVAVAGAYGGLTAKPTIFFVQGVPALVALALLMM